MASEPQGKRRELLEGAIGVLSARGYRATTIKHLADAAKLSKSTFYHYFPSKQHLLVAIFTEMLDASPRAVELVSDTSRSPDDIMRQLLAEAVVYNCRNARMTQIYMEEQSEIPKRILTKVNQNRRTYQEAVRELLERGRKQNVFEFEGTPTLVSNTLLGVCAWSYKWYNPDGPLAPEELADEIAALLLRTIQPSVE